MNNEEPAIHIFPPEHSLDTWAVWLDPDAGSEQTGICIGVGDSRASAMLNAEVELRQVTKRLEWMREEKTT